MKIYVVLIALVFLAGCANNGNKKNVDDKKQTINTPPTQTGELSIFLQDLPQEISKGETKYFKIVADAKESVESVRVLVYNLGSYLESSCAGGNSLRDIGAGKVKEASCSIKAIDTPLEEVSQDLLYEAKYKIKEYKGQAKLRVYDKKEFSKGVPTDSDSIDIGAGTLEVNPANVEEGKEATINLRLDGDFEKGDNCACNIEKVTLKLPRGFSVSGLTDWARYACGEFNCYEKQGLNAPTNKDFTVSIAGVTKTDTFYIGVEVWGVWKSTQGTNSITVLAN